MIGGAGDGGPVQVFVDLTRFAATAHVRATAGPVRALDDVGATRFCREVLPLLG